MTMLASGFPIGDLQFWIVTAIGAAALLFLLRGFLPARLRPRARGGGGKKATLTVEGRSVKPRS